MAAAQALRGNARRAYWACRNAYLLSRQLSDPLLQALALCHGIYALTILGEFREADRLLKEAASLSWNVTNSEIRFFYSLSQIAYLVFTGDPRQALDHCEKLLAETEGLGLSYLYPVVLLHKQFALVYLQEDLQVQQIGTQIAALAAAVKNDYLAGAAEYYRGVSAYWSRRFEEAREWIETVIRALLPEAVFEAAFNRLREGEPSREKRAVLRRISAGSSVLEPDSQGRVAVPAELLAAVGITKRVYVVGMADRMELFDPDRYAVIASVLGDADPTYLDTFLS